MKKISILLILVLSFVVGCGKEEDVKVVKIDQAQAIEYIDDGALLIDVRSNAEYNQGHIDGAINVDVQDILEMSDSLIYNNTSISKSKSIIVYCRSGSRSNNAAEYLVELGYTNVYDLGAMDNWSE